MKLSKAEIRCTSVDGYRLPAGANTDEQLRREVLEAPVLVGLISHNSFESAYVLFDLGARWGNNSFLIPVLAKGVSASIIRGPLSSLNALSCDSASQIHQLVSDIAASLKIQLEPASAYQENVDSVFNSVPVVDNNISTVTSIPKVDLNKQKTHINEDAYADSNEVIRRHCETQWGNDYEMRLHCEEKQKSAVESLRIEYGRGIPLEIFRRIRDQAEKDWPDDYEMRLHTEKNQIQAFKKLNSSI